MSRLFILPMRYLKISTEGTQVGSIKTTLSYHYTGTERVGREIIDVRAEGNKVYFKFAPDGPQNWANSGEFRQATGTEEDLRKLVRHQDKMFIKELWQGGRAKAREFGLRKWYVS